MAVFKPGQSYDDCYVSSAGIIEKVGDVSQFGLYVFDEYAGGFKFANVTIPQGTIITSAKVTFQAWSDQATTVCNIRIKGEDIDDAAVFSTYDDFIARTRTTAYVDWSAISEWTINTDYDSPSITTIIQEILDRVGWISGNDLVLFFENNGSTGNGNRLPKTYDLTTDYCARLTVTHSGEIRTLFRPY